MTPPPDVPRPLSEPVQQWTPMAPAANATAIGWKAKKKKKSKKKAMPTKSAESSHQHDEKINSSEKKPQSMGAQGRYEKEPVCRKRHRVESASNGLSDGMERTGAGPSPDLAAPTDHHGAFTTPGEQPSMSIGRAAEDDQAGLPVGQDESASPSNDLHDSVATRLPEGVSVKWEGAHTAVVSFVGPTHVCLVGRATVAIVSGQIDVLGYRLSNPMQTVDIESPAWTSAVTFSHIADAGLALPGKTTLRISSLRSCGALSFELKDPSGGGIRPTVIPDSWRVAMDHVLEKLSSSTSVARSDDHNVASPLDMKAHLECPVSKTNVDVCQSARSVVCGAKNVGKSTYLRYSIHRLLSSGVRQVAVLDCDTGQPELSPPGMVTLTLVKIPLLSPPHYHIVMGSRSVGTERHVDGYFFGDTTSKADPSFYLRCIRKLLTGYVNLVEDEYDGRESSLPLLVNTDGWVKGMGFEILSALIDLISPGHIVQLQGALRSKQFDLSPTLQDSKATLHTAHSYDNSSAAVLGPSRASSVASLQSLDIDVAGPVPSIPSQFYRTLRLCTYFLGCSEVWDRVEFGQYGVGDYECEIANRLAAAKPYRVSLDSIRLEVQGAGTMRDLETEDSVLNTLNGSIVGLCCLDETTCRENSTVQSKDTCASCVGLGLIRSVDRVHRVVYILTPMAPSDLESVNLLVRGNIQVPFECLYRGVGSESFPFLSCDGLSVGVGSNVMKSRNTLARKGGY